jgi:hypothetical protein
VLKITFTGYIFLLQYFISLNREKCLNSHQGGRETSTIQQMFLVVSELKYAKAVSCNVCASFCYLLRLEIENNADIGSNNSCAAPNICYPLRFEIEEQC